VEGSVFKGGVMMEVKEYSREGGYIVIQEGGQQYRLSFDCLDELVKFLFKVGYLELKVEGEVEYKRRWH
jgi:hypothetical protein